MSPCRDLLLFLHRLSVGEGVRRGGRSREVHEAPRPVPLALLSSIASHPLFHQRICHFRTPRSQPERKSRPGRRMRPDIPPACPETALIMEPLPGLPVVVFQEAAEALAAPDIAGARESVREEDPVAEGLMVALPVIVGNVFRDGVPESLFTGVTSGSAYGRSADFEIGSTRRSVEPLVTRFGLLGGSGTRSTPADSMV